VNESYGGFAELYDEFMADVDYDGWCEYIGRIFARFGAAPELVLDLGCGTGNVSRRLKGMGLDVIGIDKSADMLAVAKAKDPDILYIQQDIRAFELYGTVDACVSLCDVLNYCLTKSDLMRVFKLVHNYLNPGGLFIFDINTAYKYRRVLGNRLIARQNKRAAIIWDNRYYPKNRINEYRLTFFKKRDNGMFARFFERHLQRAHPPPLIHRLLKSTGFTVLGVYDEKTFRHPRARAQRVFFVARKNPSG